MSTSERVTQNLDTLTRTLLGLSPSEKFAAASMLCKAGRPELAGALAQRAIEELELARLLATHGAKKK